MSKAKKRPSFQEWLDQTPEPTWEMLPLTHVTKGVGAEDIVRDGQITPSDDEYFKVPTAYFFYGRPAYRVSGDGAIKVEAACPYCFIFDPSVIDDADTIYAFDTGAFSKRMYRHHMMEEMRVEDFSLEQDELFAEVGDGMEG